MFYGKSCRRYMFLNALEQDPNLVVALKGYAQFLQDKRGQTKDADHFYTRANKANAEEGQMKGE